MNNRISFEELTGSAHFTEETDRLVLFINWFLLNENCQSLDDKVRLEAFQSNTIYFHSRRVVIHFRQRGN